MIKKTLLGIGIAFFGLLGISFVRANEYGIFEGDIPMSFYMSEYNNIVNNGLSFESVGSDLVSNKRLFLKFSSSQYKSIFWNDGKLYFYSNVNDYHYQGYINKFCKIYSENGGFEQVCAENRLNISEFYSLDNPNFTKFWIYPAGGITNFCVYDIISKYYYCFGVEDLTGSLNIPENSIDYSSYAENSPYLSGTGNNPIKTGTNNNYICPTIRQVMQNMGENYNTGLCYNNTSYFNGTSFEQIEQEDIFTIFNDDYQNYINRISIYRNNCTNTNTTQACQNAFSGEYKKYSIISNAINSNVDEKKLRNYCNLGLNYDPNATTCVASGGGIKEKYTTEEMINDIINNGVIPTTDSTGSVLNALKKCENGDRECYINNRNFIDSLKNIYGKITGLFKERNGINGIIPNYILRITFLTILFTVIFKK